MTFQVEPYGRDPFAYRTVSELASSGSSETATIGPYDGLLVSSTAEAAIRFRAKEGTTYFTMTVPAGVYTIPVAFDGMSSATSTVAIVGGVTWF